VPSSAAATTKMKANRRRDTKPERRLRSALYSRGLRFRVDHRIDLAGARARPDIVFPRQRIAIYVDGCFWHRCPVHGTAPNANEAFWRAKLDANVARDLRTTAALEASGWRVLRIWEHVSVEEATERVVDVLGP